jgi:hypothetical protein
VSGHKHDAAKTRMDLLPPRPLVEIAEILTFGAEKYAAYNWSQGIAFSRLFAAMLRHLWAWWGGEDCDRETGKSHLAHAGCCLIFLMDLRHRRTDCDDRPGGLVAPAFDEEAA